MTVKGSEEELGKLHGAIARDLTQRIIGRVVAAVDVEGNPTETVVYASAAELAAAITFLKNNGITADAAENEDLKSLNDSLQKRRRGRKLTPADLSVVESEFDNLMGVRGIAG
jgi:glycerate kinase